MEVHEWVIRWSLAKIEYLVDGVVISTATDYIPQGTMQANEEVWAPDSTWPQAYSAALQPASTASQNQTFIAHLTLATIEQLSSSSVPSTDSGTPSAGAGQSQLFTFKYSSPSGYGYIRVAETMFNSTLKGSAGCWVYYDQPSNSLNLVNDAGTGSTAIAVGSAGTLSNSQCTLTGSGSSVSGSGNTLVTTLALSFQNTFASTQTIYGYVSDYASANSDWQTLGYWNTVASPAPTADSVTPNAGTGSSQTFVFKYSSGDGWGFLRSASALFNSSVNGANACWVYFDAPSNTLNLVDNTGTTYRSIIIGTSDSISNGQCTLSGPGSSAFGSGNTLTVTLPLSFNSSFGVLENIYSYALDAAGANSAWQNVGAWTTMLVSLPTTDSVVPNSGTGTAQKFTFKYSSSGGFAYLKSTIALFNTSLNGAGACWVYFDRPSNTFNLVNDAGTIPMSMPVGSSSVISNGQCTLDGTGSSISGSGNTLTMVLSLTLKSSFAGTQTIYGYALDSAGAASGWVNLGTWKPTAAGPPTADSVTPDFGAGTSQTFTFKYSSAGGYAYLRQTLALFNTSLNGAGACWVYYDQPSNTFNLVNDARTSATSIVAGTSGVLSNSQCSLNGSGSGISRSGNSLTMSVMITFSPNFTALLTVFADALDAVNATSGWQTLGTWSPGQLALAAVLNTCTVSGTVSNVSHPENYRILVWAETNQYYIQPCVTAPVNAITASGSFGPVATYPGTIYVQVVSSTYVPPYSTPALPAVDGINVFATSGSLGQAVSCNHSCPQ